MVILINSVLMAYMCEECDKEFTKKSHYDRHTVTHTQERKYKCPE